MSLPCRGSQGLRPQHGEIKEKIEAREGRNAEQLPRPSTGLGELDKAASNRGTVQDF